MSKSNAFTRINLRSPQIRNLKSPLLSPSYHNRNHKINPEENKIKFLGNYSKNIDIIDGYKSFYSDFLGSGLHQRPLSRSSALMPHYTKEREIALSMLSYNEVKKRREKLVFLLKKISF